MQTFQEAYNETNGLYPSPAHFSNTPIISTFNNKEPSISKCDLYNKTANTINIPQSNTQNSTELKRKQEEENDIEHSIKRKRIEINKKQKEFVMVINKLTKAVKEPHFTKEIIEYNLYTKDFTNTIKIINNLLIMSNTTNDSHTNDSHTNDSPTNDSPTNDSHTNDYTESNDLTRCLFVKENKERCNIKYFKKDVYCWRHR